MPELVPPVLPAGALSSQAQPVLRAGDLRLRPWEPGDAPALVAAYADPGVQHWNGESLTEAQARAYAQVWAEHWRAERLTQWAFGEAGFHRLELQHSTGDPASCRVAEKCGFALEGTRVRSLLHADGWHDTHLHGRAADQ